MQGYAVTNGLIIGLTLLKRVNSSNIELLNDQRINNQGRLFSSNTELLIMYELIRWIIPPQVSRRANLQILSIITP